jgi:hypothetical protein
MDPKEIKHQINTLLTVTLPARVGKDPYILDGSTQELVSLYDGAKHGDPDGTFTTILRAKPMRSTVKQVRITQPLIQALGALKEGYSPDRTVIHQHVKFQIVVVEGSPTSSRASSLSAN